MIQRLQPIRDEEGNVCGELSAYVIATPDQAASITARVARIVSSDADAWPLVYIHLMNVSADKRGRGIGSAALRQFLAEIFHEGIRLALLNVGQFDATTAEGQKTAFRLKRLYERIGFTEVVANGLRKAIDDPLEWVKHGEMTWMYMLSSTSTARTDGD